MGPTGAGKSSFIEVLGQNPSLGISKNQLESYTKTVTSYRITNAEYVPLNTLSNGPLPVYLIDTPGFCDSKMSEMEILEQLRDWMGNHGIKFIHHILYLLPITDTRLSGKKRRTIEMFKSIVGGPSYHMTIVTTMWDQIWDEQRRERAASNMIQLRKETWEKYDGHGTMLTPFLNSHESALDILGYGASVLSGFPNIFPPLLRGNQLRETELGSHILLDLRDRLDAVRQQKGMLERELSEPDTQAIEELETLLRAQLHEAERTLWALENQMWEFEHRVEKTALKNDEPSTSFLGNALGIWEGISSSFMSWFN